MQGPLISEIFYTVVRPTDTWHTALQLHVTSWLMTDGSPAWARLGNLGSNTCLCSGLLCGLQQLFWTAILHVQTVVNKLQMEITPVNQCYEDEPTWKHSVKSRNDFTMGRTAILHLDSYVHVQNPRLHSTACFCGH